jgi:hypothetical protein
MQHSDTNKIFLQDMFSYEKFNDLKEAGCEGVDWIRLAQNTDQ